MADNRYRFEPLGKHHNRAAFACGVEELDRYLRERARQDMDRNIAVVFVLVDVEAERIAGFYTLSTNSIRLQRLPSDVARKLPRYELLPVVLLGRLAVDERYRGQGLREVLLLHALDKALASTVNVAAMAVIVDAKGDDARRFYERYDFQRMADDEYRLFISMGTIAKLLG
jgi:GNAT superfamily N-acetyltransferase